MSLRADCHIHIYPRQDAARTLRAAMKHLNAMSISPADRFAIFLTESHDCNWFASLKDGSHGLPDDFLVSPTPEAEAVDITFDHQTLSVFAGRQIVTAEHLVIMALTLAEIPEDGKPAAEVIKTIQQAGAIPVLSWAPGKWMFARAAKVKNLIANTQGPLLLGDTSLRCKGWPLPAPMRETVYPLLAGSDHLPAPGEENQAGRYGVEIDLILDPAAPVSSVRQALLNPATQCRFIGKRSCPLTMLSRMVAHRKHKKAGAGQ